MVLLVVLLGIWVAGDNPTPAIDLVVTQSVQSVPQRAAHRGYGGNFAVRLDAVVMAGNGAGSAAGCLAGRPADRGAAGDGGATPVPGQPADQRDSDAAAPVDPPVWVYRDELSYSFPSGHVMEYVMLFGLLMWLAYRCMRPGALRTLTLVGMGLLIGLVGVSRIYLGAHWLTDVVGAYLAGAACLAWAMWVISEHYGFAAQGR